MAKKASDVGDMENAYLYCRERGHHWRHRNDRLTYGAGKRVREVERTFTCVTCATDVTETVSVPDFLIVRRKYDYPDNYLADTQAIGGRLHRHDIRREQFTRAGIKF